MTDAAVSPLSIVGRFDDLRYECQVIYRQFSQLEVCHPSVVVHAPGRVNIIGEHIDYCGYAVFPMALEQGITIAAVPRKDGLIRLSNVDSTRYCTSSPIQCEEVKLWTRNGPSLQWQDYVWCGLRGCLEARSGASPNLTGVTMLVSGNIPPACGVSSSSALVIASALVGCVVWGIKTTRVQLAEACAKAERYVGTEGGGMDQAISLLGEAGAAKLVEFNPLRSTTVRLPAGATFVVCNSMVTMEKAATVEFNTRVVECRLACQVMAHLQGLNWEDFRVMKKLQDHLQYSFDEMLELVRKHLRDVPYTKKDVCEALGVSEDKLENVSLNAQTKDCDQFDLKKRALHVFSEAGRVWDFKNVCEDVAFGDARLPELGRLMNASHSSCRDLYACSHPVLDELQVVASKHAFGARLTGAGWGGCLVALVAASKVKEFLDAVKTDFYAKHEDMMGGRTLEELMFVTAPAEGATAIEISI